MKLSMHIIQDRIKDILVETKTSDSWERKLRGVRALKGNEQAFSEDHVYVLYQSQISMASMRIFPSAVIIIGADPIATFEFPEMSEILRVQEGTTVDDVLCIVQQVFEEYDEWQRTFNEALLERKSVQEILKICSAVFENPVLLKDCASYCLAWAGTLPEKLNMMWQTIIATNYAEIPKVSGLPSNNQQDRDALVGKDPVLLEIEFPDGVSTMLYCNIFLEGQNMGSFAMDDIVAPLTKGDKDLCAYVASNLSSLFRNLVYYPRNTDTLKHIMQRSLFSDTDLSTEIKNRLIQRGYVPESSLFMIVRVCFQDALSDFTNNYFDRIFVEQDQNVLVTCRAQENSHAMLCTSSFKPEPLLSGALHGLHVVLGLSMPMSKFRVRSLYQQASAAIDTGKQLKPDDQIFYFKDFAADYLCKKCLAQSDTYSICHPYALALFEYDGIYHTDYLSTLAAFCDCNGNKTLTSEKLYIHRNTLNYRLLKMCEILGVPDTNDLFETDLFYLNLSCKLLNYSVRAAGVNATPFSLNETSKK